MGEQFVMNSRQQELLQILLSSSKPVSYQYLAEMFKVSTRTIQREVSSLKAILKTYQLKLVKKFGAGIQIEGAVRDKESFMQQLLTANSYMLYTPEERQEAIMYELLLNREPIKQFVLSYKFGVTEATVSNDLDKIDQLCQTMGVQLIRKPGIGVAVEGEESQKRMACSKLIHKDITFEEWFEIFQMSSSGEESAIGQLQLGTVVKKRLQKFIHSPNIHLVEKIVKEAIGQNGTIKLSDRNYVNLIVHLLLAIERMKYEEIEGDAPIIPYVDHLEEFQIAIIIAEKLEQQLHIRMPKTEIGYITLHLYGARFQHQASSASLNDLDIEWVDLTKSFIRSVEKCLHLSLSEDLILYEGLCSHLVSAINRLKLGLQIHNPMLKEIQKRYDNIFSACEQASSILVQKLGRSIPQDEIGYLAMHIGAAALRKKEQGKPKLSAIIVCASGMGTSTYLSSKLRKEIQGLQVEHILSVTELKEYMNEKNDVDLIVSTVVLPFLDQSQYIIVSPFLDAHDLQEIQKRVSFSSTRKDDLVPEEKRVPSAVVSSAKYGEAMLQIVRNLKIFEVASFQQQADLSEMMSCVRHFSFIKDEKQVLSDLVRREQQGNFILNGLALFHSRTTGVEELFAALFRFHSPVYWAGEEVSTFLLLLAPKDSPKEHIQMISEISANLIEDSFMNMLLKDDESTVRSKVETLLSQVYFAKLEATLKEPVN
ncbi:BglG family transcription antiterminator [Bacillus songklensis]|uniref:BglG family transcription antiterminator n=1 Tax=Bacillus songklensis TaxID=1069116 RepID=A0ABV8AWT9_9BACI